MKYFPSVALAFVISTKGLKIDRRSYPDNQLRHAEFEFVPWLNKIAKPVAGPNGS